MHILLSMQMGQPEFVIKERTMGIMGKDSKGNRKHYEKASFSKLLVYNSHKITSAVLAFVPRFFF